MKKRRFLILGAIVGPLVAGLYYLSPSNDLVPSLSAQERPSQKQDGRNQGRGGGRGSGGGNPIIRTLDANGDGIISKQEIDNSTALLKKLDRNGDGKISRDEMRPPRDAGGNNPPPAPRPSTPSSPPKNSLGPKPAQATSFNAFAPKVKTTWDKQYLYVESDSIPDHQMMVGITAWQQQVPITQPYTGNNVWRIPLQPVPAKAPMSAKNNFFRGAIALAANGIPIFNPIKNDGRTDTFLAGELDRFGGHCGRADDYHYHIAPLHLQKTVGAGNPVAYALDGYPLLGLTEPDGTAPRNLDSLNGHSHGTLGYHYHSTRTYPYINGGFHGQVTEAGGQVDPQPRAQGVRPALPGLRGAKITGFHKDEQGWNSLVYQINNRLGSVRFLELKNKSYQFEFKDTNGNTRNETYQRRQVGAGRGGRNGQSPSRRPR
ncbi:MAG: YHYH protein [Verrucomicrobiales bacterium]|nr:YHYH protein [Verrucomicrobiales bacterium]